MHYAIDKISLVFLLLVAFFGQPVMAVEQKSSGNATAEQAEEFVSDTGSKNTGEDEEPADEDNEEPECD